MPKSVIFNAFEPATLSWPVVGLSIVASIVILLVTPETGSSPIKAQAADIAERLKQRRLGAHTVQVKVRYGDFTTLSRQISLEEPVTEAREIYRVGCSLLGRDRLVCRPLRLLGLGVSNPTEAGVKQLVLL